ncbi:MAG: hypothetical protein M0Q44_01575 [Methylobacter sp.]|jgi:hypothetical protein|nr:hypothetical protein [Methylobacter sp.]
MVLQELHQKAFNRQYAYALEDKVVSDTEIKELGCRNSWTAKELIELLQKFPENDLVFIGNSGDTENMTPRFVPIRYNFKDDDENDEEGFVLLGAV